MDRPRGDVPLCRPRVRRVDSAATFGGLDRAPIASMAPKARCGRAPLPSRCGGRAHSLPGYLDPSDPRERQRNDRKITEQPDACGHAVTREPGRRARSTRAVAARPPPNATDWHAARATRGGRYHVSKRSPRAPYGATNATTKASTRATISRSKPESQSFATRSNGPRNRYRHVQRNRSPARRVARRRRTHSPRLASLQPSPAARSANRCELRAEHGPQARRSRATRHHAWLAHCVRLTLGYRQGRLGPAATTYWAFS